MPSGETNTFESRPVGEIGFDRQTDAEEAAIRAQLKLAKKFDMPVLVHLPHQFKKVGTERTLKVVLDHRKICLLAAQLHEDHAANIGMIGIVGEDAQQHINVGTVRTTQ